MWEELLHGSIVACLYAMGFSAEEIYKIFKKYCRKIKYVDIVNIFKLIFGLLFTGQIQIDGLNNGKQIEKLMDQISKMKGITRIQEIKNTLAIPCVDMCKGEVICFTSCQLGKEKKQVIYINDITIGKAVRASCSYPVVFSPCPYQNTKLIDGGIRENVPWKELKELGAKKVLSILFEEKENQKCEKNLVEVAGRSISLLCKELSNYEMEGADEVLKIKSEKVGLLDMKKIDELYRLGYQQTKKFLKSEKGKLFF